MISGVELRRLPGAQKIGWPLLGLRNHGQVGHHPRARACISMVRTPSSNILELQQLGLSRAMNLECGLTIGDLSRETGCKVQTIRYYEKIGLMPKPERTAGNQRRYNIGQRDRLAFIRHGRQLGFPLEAIRELVSLADHPENSCDEADTIARRQLKQVEQRLVRLEALRIELNRMIQECSGGQTANCRVLEVLSDHSECLTDHHESNA